MPKKALKFPCRYYFQIAEIPQKLGLFISLFSRKIVITCFYLSISKFDQAFIEKLGFTLEELEKHKIYEPVGCDNCHGGYKGRVAIHEALYFTKDIRRMIFEAKGDINEEVIKEQAIKDGMLTLQQSARMRVLEGLASFEEVARVTSDD